MAVKVVSSSAPKQQQDGFLLGDAVEKIARPIAKAVGLDPGCGPCAKRKQALNDLSRRTNARVRKIFQRG